MNQPLERVKNDIEEYLRNEQFVVFHGYLPKPDLQPLAFWDTNRHPDFREYLNAARGLGVKVIVLTVMTFTRGMLEDARFRLEDCDMPSEERRGLEKRLREFRRYEGFTCGVDLLFDHQGRTFIYSRHADWYQDFAELSSLIDDYASYEDEEEDEDDYPGDLFSRN